MTPFHWLKKMSFPSQMFKKIDLRPEIEGEWEKWFVSVNFGKDGATEPKFGTQKITQKNIRHRFANFLHF